MIELFKHQADVLEETEEFNKVGYYLDMGLGKTYLGSEKMKELGNKKNLVIVQKSKIEDWTEHFKEFYPEYKLYNLRNKKHLDKFIECKDFGIGIINYELTFRRPQLLELKDITLVLDESSYIKNSTAKRTKFIMKLNSKNVILLSGTPVSGKYEELWSQCRLLGWNITKKRFYQKYIITHRIEVGGFPIEIVTGYKNVEDLKEKLAEYGAVFMKTEEVIELPEQIDSDIVVKRVPEYNRFKKDSYVEFKDIELIGDTTLTKMLYERQLCGQYNKNKITAFKEHIEGTYDRIIVFYNFTKEYEILKEQVGDRPVSVVNGAKRDLKAYENEDDSITFIQYQAGSTGLNLQKANKILYYTPPLSAEHYMQSKKRIHRINQDKTCFYYFMKTEKSIENKIYSALERGEDFTNKLFE